MAEQPACEIINGMAPLENALAAVHPRIFFTPETVAELRRKRHEEPWKGFLDRVRRLADQGIMPNAPVVYLLTGEEKYLAMSRAADRQGYPEVAEAYRRIAYEEADHAARFAELLGEVVDADSKVNLKVRVEAEYGATSGKVELAKLAKELGYDAIHDTVHEMARDEARHGKAFQGLLERYFA